MGPPQRHAPLQPIRAGHPLELIAIDVMGPLPKTQKGNSYIVVVSDYLVDGVSGRRLTLSLNILHQ